MTTPENPQEKTQPTRKENQSRLRQDLLSPAEAKSECYRRMVNVLPDLPALILVIILGGFGAALAKWWHLNIGAKEFTAATASSSIWLLICLGSLGASATVFFLAKTDTSKLIHCGLIAVLSGMAGPYLVTKALSTVVSVNPELVRVDAAITFVKSTTDTLERAIEAPAADPQKFIDALNQTAQSTISYLGILKSAPKVEKEQSLAGTKKQLQNTLKVLDAAALVAPKQSLQLITKVANEANAAGAPDIAQDAQNIINTNSAVRTAADTAAQSGKAYFIAPKELTDMVLQRLNNQIKAKFPFLDIQAVVHPKREIDAGLEIVYYRDVPEDKQTAEDLAKLVVDYLKGLNVPLTNPKTRKGSTDQTTAPFQFDIHIGPDLASKFVIPK